MLERLFQLQAHGTTVRKEVVAGITTFLTMAYIIVVNPSILSSTGMDFDVFQWPPVWPQPSVR